MKSDIQSILICLYLGFLIKYRNVFVLLQTELWSPTFKWNMSWSYRAFVAIEIKQTRWHTIHKKPKMIFLKDIFYIFLTFLDLFFFKSGNKKCQKMIFTYQDPFSAPKLKIYASKFIKTCVSFFLSPFTLLLYFLLTMLSLKD